MCDATRQRRLNVGVCCPATAAAVAGVCLAAVAQLSHRAEERTPESFHPETVSFNHTRAQLNSFEIRKTGADLGLSSDAGGELNDMRCGSR